jgi:hypothetical protein
VLTQQYYKQRAIELPEAIVRSGWFNQAADIIEQVVLTGKSVFAQQ